ncbi:Mut7-C RNAse domain-containing protein [Parasphingorhabdus pacifica]
MDSDAKLWIRTSPGLRFFLSAGRRDAECNIVPHDGTASLGHVVESLGVPLPEVGTLLVNDVVADPSHRPRAGDRITVRPVQRPQRIEPRFVLDVHLGTLARYLRLLGVDTAYHNDAADEELVTQAQRENRTLLTQDRGLLRRRALPSAAYVRGSRPTDQLTDVIDRFAPALRPWSRCTACNGELLGVAENQVAEQLRAGTRRNYDVFARCTSCGKVYWRGAHARRIEKIIDTARHVHPDSA